jgi:hypothetical protein
MQLSMKTTVGVIAALLLGASSLFAQTTTGIISGRIVDPQGLAVPASP